MANAKTLEILEFGGIQMEIELQFLAATSGGTVQIAIRTGAKLTMQAVITHIAQPVAEGWYFNLLGYLITESSHQERTGNPFTETTSTEIKEIFIIELASGGTVRAFHIVIVYFQEGLSIDRGFIGEEDVTIGLVGFGFHSPILN